MPNKPTHENDAPTPAKKEKGRLIGEFRFSELSHWETLSMREAAIFRSIRDSILPPVGTDPKVRDYFPEQELAAILDEVQKKAKD
jgi:hypothetical protein